MQTVIFLLIMSILWAIFYIGLEFSHVAHECAHTYFIIMHTYFIGFILARRMYKDKKEREREDEPNV